MTPTDVVKLFAIVRNLCPAQRLDEFTPDVWERVFEAWERRHGTLDFEQAEAAVWRLGQRLRFIAAADVLAEVSAPRRDRLDRFVDPLPDCDPDDVAGYQRALAANRARVAADPDSVPAPGWLATRTVHAVARPAALRELPCAPRRNDPPRWMTVGCPTCGAEPHAMCTYPGTEPPVEREEPHSRRSRAAYPQPGASPP